MQILFILLLGLLTGLVSGLLGVGGGTIMVPVFTYFFKMSIQKAIGTSLAIMVPIALVGSLRHWGTGNVDVTQLAFFTLMALVGGWLGASLVSVVSVSFLKKMFALFLVFVAVQMFFKG
jgi:hypothetical protein